MSMEPPGGKVQGWSILILPQVAHSARFDVGYPNCSMLKQEGVSQQELTYRTLLEPYQVYSKGVTEWEALDEIKHIHAPYQMLWSLIYRKLKGNRGNTMITLYEAERLFKLLRDKNARNTLTGEQFTFALDTQEVVPSPTRMTYSGRIEHLNYYPRLRRKFKERKSFEAHLQAYIVENIGRGVNQALDTTLLDNSPLEWLGNEVSCGVGMQRIDVMLSLAKENAKIVVPIELKSVEASADNVRQMQRYVDWLEQYYLPNRPSDIQPVLMTRGKTNKSGADHASLIAVFREFNGDYSAGSR